MTDELHESLCEKCGRCCHAKVLVDGVVYFTRGHCRFLDAASGLCSVYDRRFELNNECIPVARAVQLGALPGDCPYVPNRRNYSGPKPFEELVASLGEEFAEKAAREALEGHC
ncbi:MAG: hypothetical protein U5N86_00155 [Planctomycetota bacterium]|nr:hypothetical protein [Planctomycetota bacterium]